MDEQKIRDLLPDFVRGDVDKEESRAIEQALASSPALAAECARLKAYYDALENLPPVNAPDEFLAAVNRRIDRPSLLQRIAARVFLPLRWKIPMELAGVAVCGLLLLVLFRPEFKQAFVAEKESQSAPIAATKQDETLNQASAPVVSDDRAAEAQAAKSTSSPQRIDALVDKKEEQKVSRRAAAKGQATMNARQEHALSKERLAAPAQTIPPPATRPPETYAAAKPMPEPFAGASGQASNEAVASAPLTDAAPAAIPQAEAEREPTLIELSMTIGDESTYSQSIDEAASEKSEEPRSARRQAAIVKDVTQSRAKHKAKEAAAGPAPVESPASIIARIEALIRSHHGAFTVEPADRSEPGSKVYEITIDKEEYHSFMQELVALGQVQGQTMRDPVAGAAATLRVKLTMYPAR
jgi:hypothetical protein